MQYASGKTRLGFLAFQASKIVRVRWNKNSSEGVDINLVTGKSPIGAWKMIG